jgi:ubiquinone/menaquinone biosynthesis C-methylase UbiE
MNLKEKIISILNKCPADQYTLYRQIGNVKVSEITKVIADLQARKIIYVIKHRKSHRTGLAIPIYCLSVKSHEERNRLNIDSLLAGVTSERLVEYPFLARNLISRHIAAKILDIGCGESDLTKTISKFGNKKWQVIGIDIAKLTEKKLDIQTIAMIDARTLGFRNEVFDQIICISTIEHIGKVSGGHNTKQIDQRGDMLAMSEIYRVLKKGGTVIVTLPYSNRLITKKQGYRLYNNSELANLTSAFLVIKKEYYLYEEGKWKKCNSQQEIDKTIDFKVIPFHLHSVVCVCMLLKKET